MGAFLEKLFGPGSPPPIQVDTTGACSSECCDEVEFVSSSSSNSEPHTHPSAHAVTDSYNTIPDIENVPCSSGTSVAERKVCQMSGGQQGIRLEH